MAVGKKLRFEVFKRDEFTCTYCGAKSPDVQLEADHIQPRSKGGKDVISNLATACRDCNSGKRDIPIELHWTLARGPQGPGPLDGQQLSSTQRFPGLWVYRYDDGEYAHKIDTVDAGALLENPWIIWLRGKEPEDSELFMHPDKPHQKHCGFYLPLTAECVKLGHLCWIDLRESFWWIKGIGDCIAPRRIDESEWEA